MTAKNFMAGRLQHPARDARGSDQYDRAYFDKWYRDPRHRVGSGEDTRRKAALALAITEYYLGRKVRSVLDVGCGEGQWQPVLKAMRPRIQYTGIDPSAYAIRRFGKRRNLLLGSLGHLPALPTHFDLLLCSNSLYYVPDDELLIGLEILIPRLRGLAFLEAYSPETPLEGDTPGMIPRSPAQYRKIFRHVGLVSCGSHFYAPKFLHDRVTAMERGWM
jgi:SAM-dependent methyltransferase